MICGYIAGHAGKSGLESEGESSTKLKIRCIQSFTFRFNQEIHGHSVQQFGEAIALYFAFLSSYALSLVYIAGLGIAFYLLRMPYSSIYSTLLVLWSTFFVEFWRIKERILSVRWGTRGSFRVERHRAQFKDAGGKGLGFPWWKRDTRIFASLPVILLFAGVLAAFLTMNFLLEAFVTQLYTGPGQKIIVSYLWFTDILFI